MRKTLTFLAASAAMTAVALAQNEAGVAEGGLWDTINDSLYTLVLAVIPILASVIGFYAKQFMGQRVGQMAQEMFQKAAERAASAALEKAPASELSTNKTVTAETVKTGTDYLNKTMPETIKQLGVTPTALQDIILANIGKLKLGVANLPEQPIKK